MTSKPDRELELLAVPPPPEELRTRVLSATASALAREPRRDAWTAIWESRAARLAWTAALACLLIAHLALSVGPRLPRHVAGFGLAISADAMDEELAAIADLPALDLDAQARGAVDGPPAATDTQHEATTTDKETS